MNLANLFWSTSGLYILGWFICNLSFFHIRKNWHKVGELALFTGLVLHVIYIGIQFFRPNSSTFLTTAGILLFASLLTIIIYFILDYLYRKEIFEIIFPPLTLFFLLLSSLIANQILLVPQFITLSPMVGKFMIFIHASFSLIGYLLFGVACLTSIFFLKLEQKIKNKTLSLQDIKVPSLGFLDRLNHRVITSGFLFLTVGLLVGITLNLIVKQGFTSINLRLIFPIVTWGFYAFILFDRSIRGLSGKYTATWSIIGFIAAAFSFVYEMIVLTNAYPKL